MFRLGLFTLVILIIALTSDGSSSILQEKDEESRFKLLPIKQFLEKKIVVIYYSNATRHLLKNFFTDNKDEQVKLINTDISPKLSSISTRKFNIFVLVFIKKETIIQFKEISFSYGDIFIYIENDEYNYSERQKICQRGISIPNIAALYNTYNEKFYVCRYYYNGQAVSVVEVGKNDIPPVWKILNTFSSFKEYQFNIGYLIFPPAVFRQVLKAYFYRSYVNELFR